MIALSAVLLLAVLYSVKKSLSSGQAAAPAQQTQEAGAGKTADGTSEPQQAMAAPADDGEGAQYHFVGNPPRDPFAPQMQGAMPGEAHGGFIKAPPSAPPEPAKRSRTSKAANGSKLRFPQPGSLAPYQFKGLPDLQVQGPSGSSVSGGMSPSEQQSPYTATGVVRGKEDIAIIRGEGGSRYFVRQGQSVGNGYVVSMISPGGVVLKNKDQRVFLKLGGAQDAKASDRPR